MKLETIHTVRFNITDRELYDDFEANDGTLTRFLTAILDSVRYSENWSKKCVATYADEYWWDDETDQGLLDVEITISTEGGDLDFQNIVLDDISQSTGDEYPSFSKLTADSIAQLSTVKHNHGYGFFAAMVWWNTLIPHDNADEEGSLLEDEYSPEYEEFYGRIENSDTTPTLNSFIYQNGDTEIYLEGNWEGDTSLPFMKKQISEEYPNFK